MTDHIVPPQPDSGATATADQTKLAHRVWGRVLLVLFGGLIAYGGARTAIVQDALWLRVLGGVLVLPAVWMVYSGFMPGLRRFIALWRSNRGVCIHCGYSNEGTRSDCPECGKYPHLD